MSPSFTPASLIAEARQRAAAFTLRAEEDTTAPESAYAVVSNDGMTALRLVNVNGVQYKGGTVNCDKGARGFMGVGFGPDLEGVTRMTLNDALSVVRMAEEQWTGPGECPWKALRISDIAKVAAATHNRIADSMAAMLAGGEE